MNSRKPIKLKNHPPDIIPVYRGQVICLDELKLIQLNVEQFISMDSFSLTTLARETVLGFCDFIEINSEIDRTPVRLLCTTN